MDGNIKLVERVVVWNRHQDLCTAPSFSETSFFFPSTPNEQHSIRLQCNRREGSKNRNSGAMLQHCKLGIKAASSTTRATLFPRQAALEYYTTKIGSSRWSCNIDPCSITNQWSAAAWWPWYHHAGLHPCKSLGSTRQMYWLFSITRKALQVQRWLSCEDFSSTMVDVYRYVYTQDNGIPVILSASLTSKAVA